MIIKCLSISHYLFNFHLKIINHDKNWNNYDYFGEVKLGFVGLNIGFWLENPNQ